MKKMRNIKFMFPLVALEKIQAEISS